MLEMTLTGDKAVVTIVKAISTLDKWGNQVNIESKHSNCLALAYKDYKVLIPLYINDSKMTPEMYVYTYKNADNSNKLHTQIGKEFDRIIDTAIGFNKDAVVYLRFQLDDGDWIPTYIEYDTNAMDDAVECTYMNGSKHISLLEKLDLSNMLGVSDQDNIEKIGNMWLSVGKGRYVYLTDV